MAKQILITTPKDAAQALEVHGQALHAAHAQLVAILRARLGQNHGDLLALPTVRSDGSVEWSTQVAGAVAAMASLPEADRERAQQRADRILSDIRGLARQLQAESPASQVVGHMLERAASLPPGEWLYSVGGKPVLAMWGHAAAGAAPPPAPPAPVAAAAPAVSAAAPAAAVSASAGDPVHDLGAAALAAEAAAAPQALPSPPPGGAWKRWLPWAVLALLLLASLLWGVRSCSGANTAVAGKVDDEIAQAEKRNAELEDELRRKRTAQLMCVPEDKPAPPPAAAAPEAVPSAPQAAASAPEPAASPQQAEAPAPPPDPIDELKKRVAAAGTDCDRLGQLLDKEPLLKRNTAQSAPIRQQIMKSLEQNCRERAIKEARNLCPEQRPKELAPQVALVFDASGSMNFSLDATEEQIRQSGSAAQVEALLRQMMGMGGGAGGLPAHLTREPRRITVAKPAAVSVVQRMPSDVSVGLVMVDQCPAARPLGMYAPGQRGALIGQIQAIQPRAGTPLADGIAKAGEMVDGVSREAIVVVVSDGTESCGRDPCAVAADLKRRKPHLRINVVDITGTGAGNCAARLTGGQVYTARDAAEVARMMDRAAQEAMGPANCKK